jgi:hypothetical protein
VTTEMVGPAACADITDEIARTIAWQSMLTPPAASRSRRLSPSVLAAAVTELPEPDGAKITIGACTTASAACQAALISCRRSHWCWPQGVFRGHVGRWALCVPPC